jgi:hypothetical protein
MGSKKRMEKITSQGALWYLFLTNIIREINEEGEVGVACGS